MTCSRHSSQGKGSIDWWSIALYAALVIAGLVNISAAVYSPSNSGIFDFSSRYGMQMVWIGISVFVAVVILLVDTKYYHMLAYPFYWTGILILIAVLFLGREVNGAKAWIFFGSVGLQPAEFVKFTTALVVARYMSRYGFSMARSDDLVRLALLILIPVVIILFQNDTGSAIVYAAFLVPLYREGLNGWVYVGIATAVLLFVFSFFLTPVVILSILLLVCVASEGLRNGRWKGKVIYLSGILLGAILIYYGVDLFYPAVGLTFFWSLFISAVLSLPAVLLYAFRNRLRNVVHYVWYFVCALLFYGNVNFVFDNVLQLHQQKRILDLLGLEADTQNWGYHATQSKIAIGSGGWTGKGFLQGTQTRFDFIPEQSTDFIFCTVGEEWGFLGSALIVILFGLLIWRLMQMGEHQQEPFGRIYCYCVAAIFFVHVFINIGMTIGIMPVIGIPLPFFSYGGSSFLAFSILFFVAVKLDSSRREITRH